METSSSLLALQYRSEMANWDRRASVKRAIKDPHDGAGLAFSPSLFPACLHPLVASKGTGAVEVLLGRRLISYLDFTQVLEIEVISQVAAELAHDRLSFGNEPAIVADAFKISIDESHHAHEAYMTKAVVARHLNLDLQLTPARPAFMGVLESSQAAYAPQERGMVRLIFAIVSETLITSILTKLPQDEQVLPLVRQTVRDHAMDEALHHRVFARLLEIVWHRWSSSERARFGHLFGEFMEAFLRPDLPVIAGWLHGAGICGAEAYAIIEDTYPESRVRAEMNNAAQPSLRVLQRAGVLSNVGAADALHRRGFALNS